MPKKRNETLRKIFIHLRVKKSLKKSYSRPFNCDISTTISQINIKPVQLISPMYKLSFEHLKSSGNVIYEKSLFFVNP
jgi:hypothetical protein